MLLSLVLSLLLARKLSKIYAIAMIIIVGLLSFFSAFGLPKVTRIHSRFVKPVSPVPLSYPFYAYVYRYQTPPDPEDPYMGGLIEDAYSLDVLGMRIDSLRLSIMHLEDAGLYYSFFLLVNLIGAIIGYWISRAGFVDRLLKRKIHLDSRILQSTEENILCDYTSSKVMNSLSSG